VLRVTCHAEVDEREPIHTLLRVLEMRREIVDHAGCGQALGCCARGLGARHADGARGFDCDAVDGVARVRPFYMARGAGREEGQGEPQGRVNR
jgi:hypothetical protein